MTDEEETTWRALKGELPVAPLRCRLFHFHRWTAWKNGDSVDVPLTDNKHGSFKVRSWRHCADCNKPDSKLFIFKKG